MIKHRPILSSYQILPVRIALAPGEHITWYADGWIRKVYPNGNVEEWAPLMWVVSPSMNQTVLPSGALHTTYYTTDDASTATVGTTVEIVE